MEGDITFEECQHGAILLVPGALGTILEDPHGVVQLSDFAHLHVDVLVFAIDANEDVLYSYMARCTPMDHALVLANGISLGVAAHFDTTGLGPLSLNLMIFMVRPARQARQAKRHALYMPSCETLCLMLAAPAPAPMAMIIV